MFLRPIYVAAGIKTSTPFLWLPIIPLSGPATIFFYPFICWWHLGGLPLSAVVNNAAMNICGRGLVENLFAVLWGHIPTGGIAPSCSEVKVTQLYPTLCDPMDCTVHGILQARVLEWVAVPFSRESSQPGDRIQVSCIAGGFFTS